MDETWYRAKVVSLGAKGYGFIRLLDKRKFCGKDYLLHSVACEKSLVSWGELSAGDTVEVQLEPVKAFEFRVRRVRLMDSPAQRVIKILDNLKAGKK